MAAVAVVLDRDDLGLAPRVSRRPELRLVAPAPARFRPSSVVMVVALAIAALASVFFVVATGDGIPASAEFGGVAAVRQSVVPPAGAAAAIRAAGTYVVVEGDSLWSIAARLVSAESIPAFVESLAAANGGSEVHVGQVLQVPLP